MKLASVSLVLALAAVSFAQLKPSNEIIFTEKSAIGLLPPVVVAQGAPRETIWSHDGKFLLVVSVDSKITPALASDMILKGDIAGSAIIADHIISLYNLEKQSSQVVWKNRSDAAQLSQAVWLPSSRVALLVLSYLTKNEAGEIAGKQVLYALNVSNGKLTQLREGGENDFFQLRSEPDATGAILMVRRFNPDKPGIDGIEAQYVWIHPDGRMGNALNASGRKSFGEVIWAKPNRPMLVSVDVQPNSRPTQVWSELDFANGQLKAAEKPKLDYTPEPEPEFKLRQGGSQARTDDKSIDLKAAWLVAREKGPNQSALVAAEVDDMSLSPGMNAVYYSTKGVGMIRPLMTMPKELAMKALEAAERSRIISEAKQVGTAFMLYGADMDDVLPSNSSDWMESVYPYLKNREMMGGFNYTFGGGSMADVKDPSSTELGHKIGPGGRAVVYIDGHVKWIPDK